MSAPMPNPFDSNPAPTVIDARSAAATPCPPLAAAAEAISGKEFHPAPGTEVVASVRTAAASDHWEERFWLVLAEVLEFPPIDLDDAPLFLKANG
jgi:hypothetical protein